MDRGQRGTPERIGPFHRMGESVRAQQVLSVRDALTKTGGAAASENHERHSTFLLASRFGDPIARQSHKLATSSCMILSPHDFVLGVGIDRFRRETESCGDKIIPGSGLAS
jgi:hypothetical protein